MTAFKGLGTYGNAVGVVTPLDHKLSNAATLCKTTTPLVIRPGLFYSGTSSIVSGTANMSYDVAAYECATQRSASAGVVFGGNDATYNVATTAAPGSNSRYDVIYHWHREYSIDGTDSNPVIGVVQGTAAASPTVPSLAAFPGAIELARVLVPAGVTATNSGTTFTQTAPFTSVDGEIVPFRTTTEMNAWTTALAQQKARDLSTQIIYKYRSGAWVAWESDWITYTATLSGFAVGTGGSALNYTAYRWRAGVPRLKFEFIFGTSGTTFPSTPTFTLPSGLVLDAAPYSNLIIHPFAMLDSGTASIDAGRARYNGTDTDKIGLVYQNAILTTANIGTTAPWNWAAGDAMAGEFDLPVA